MLVVANVLFQLMKRHELVGVIKHIVRPIFHVLNIDFGGDKATIHGKGIGRCSVFRIDAHLTSKSNVSRLQKCFGRALNYQLPVFIVSNISRFRVQAITIGQQVKVIAASVDAHFVVCSHRDISVCILKTDEGTIIVLVVGLQDDAGVFAPIRMDMQF